MNAETLVLVMSKMVGKFADHIDAELSIDSVDALPAFDHDIEIFPGIVIDSSWIVMLL